MRIHQWRSLEGLNTGFVAATVFPGFLASFNMHKAIELKDFHFRG